MVNRAKEKQGADPSVPFHWDCGHFQSGRGEDESKDRNPFETKMVDGRNDLSRGAF